MAPSHYGCFLTQKTPIFGPTWTWNDTWMGHKSAQHIFSHCLECVLAHYPVSRLIFSLNMASCHFGCFLPPKHPFSDRPAPGMTPGWGIKVPKTSFPIAWGVFWSITQFPGCFFAQYGILSFWLFLTKKTPIFGPTWTWNDTWMGHKSAQHNYSHCLGFVLTHYPVSRLIFLLNMASCHFGYFRP